MPNNEGYSTNAPLSSQTALLQRPGICPSGPGSSNSLSTANRLPNSMSSTRCTAVPACCISWIASRDSSYFRESFPLRNENTRICRSGKEKVTKEEESGESVIHVGVDFVYSNNYNLSHSKKMLVTFLNSYRSVSLLYFQSFETFLGNEKGSTGCQYSTKPPSSAEITVSYLSLYYKISSSTFCFYWIKDEKGRTAITWMGKRCIEVIVSIGVSPPRPS